MSVSLSCVRNLHTQIYTSSNSWWLFYIHKAFHLGVRVGGEDNFCPRAGFKIAIVTYLPPSVVNDDVSAVRRLALVAPRLTVAVITG